MASRVAYPLMSSLVIQKRPRYVPTLRYFNRHTLLQYTLKDVTQISYYISRASAKMFIFEWKTQFFSSSDDFENFLQTDLMINWYLIHAVFEYDVFFSFLFKIMRTLDWRKLIFHSGGLKELIHLGINYCKAIKIFTRL